ncbi:hypothetical protein GWK47_017570 [Chionoecetes opilio]|uniref:Uncharacterized protein n=1 Tax=Chionoecetes opilio TaxID=41210 RepID=A0A8J4XSI6_CHIOP|nr:hypothetical protein GWK47_017570 [Chionoecetes opilio]
MGDQPDDAGSSSSRSRRTTDIHWSHPCIDLLKNPNITESDLSGHILHEVSTAHSFLIDFKEKYAKLAMDSTQDNQWAARLEMIRGIPMPFLNTTPPDNPYIFNSQLLHAYEKMQRLAVGIEQATLDQALYQGDLLQDFRTIETHIVKILCQLRYAMVNQELEPPVSVTKMIMSERYRDLEGTSERSIRDSIIVRDYNAAIDDLKDVFVTFENQ